MSDLPAFQLAACTRWLNGPHAATRAHVLSVLGRPEFALRFNEMSVADQRAQTLGRLQTLAAAGIGPEALPLASGGRGSEGEFLMAMETLALHDGSLLVKWGVHYILFAGSVHRLGTSAHHAEFLPLIATLALPGCFALTELNHGSDAREIETTAHYEPTTREFVLHTPHARAGKNYIGNATDAQMATVFAQLHADGINQGVHALLVRIRDTQGRLTAGVRIEDCGLKLGLNGVDNGRIWFDRVRVPRGQLLDRFGQVAADGTYDSPLKSPAARFFATTSALASGRVGLVAGGLSVAKIALTVAVRYGARRRQFRSAKDGLEQPLLDYPAHQERLLPLLAKTYALNATVRRLVADFVARTPESSRAIEVLAAGLKAYGTWHASHTVQTCRECCGGEGYLRDNRLADLRADSDVWTTFDGDNTVLLQLLAKSLLQPGRGNAPSPAPSSGRLVRLLHARWHNCLETLLARLATERTLGKNEAEAFLSHQSSAVRLAQAYVDWWIAHVFEGEIQSEVTHDFRAWLDPLFRLHALCALRADSTGLVASGALNATEAWAWDEDVRQLCRELRPAAPSLVEAFGIPDHCVGARIADQAFLNALVPPNES